MFNLRPFQIGLLATFAIIGVLSVVILSSYTGGLTGSSNPYGERVTIWGTLSGETFLNKFENIGREDRDFGVVEYQEKDPRTFVSELVNSIADGTAPDAIILDSDLLVSLRSKLQPITYDTISKRTFKDAYVDGAEVFALEDGIYAIPFLIDPMVMYWNRDIFSSSGFALPPTTWEKLTDITKQITLRDVTRNILQATVAFGQYDNVKNAKATLLMLLLQSGSKMISEDGERYKVVLDSSVSDEASHPFSSTIQFFVEFGNSNSTVYSWNRSFTSDLSEFVGGKLALYFGFGSESANIRAKNPNLNFDTAAVPQGSGATVKRDFARFYGIAFVKTSDNLQGAYQSALKLSSSDISRSFATSFSMAPADRYSLSLGSSDPFEQTVYNQALISRAWLDPNPDTTNSIFSTLIDDVVSNRKKVGQAVSDALEKLRLAF